MENCNGGKSFGYVGRQCILDKTSNVYGYELLYRSGFLNKADVKNNKEATSKVLINLIDNVGLHNFFGDKKAFINFDETLIHFPFEEIVDGNKIVLEILEHSEIDQKFVNRLNDLKNKGFEIALDDFSFKYKTKDLFDMADYIKIDVLETPEDEIKDIVEKAKKRNITLLAEKVETLEIYNKYKELGFDLFQGYFFARPQVIIQKQLNPSQATLINILNELNEFSQNLDKIEDLIKNDAHLSYNLLKFINSAYFNFNSEIKNIRHAISLLGIQKLKVWIILLLYSNDFSFQVSSNPLFELAIIRSKILEILASKYRKDRDFAGEAYLLGLLSLCDIILGIEKREFVSTLRISEEIKNAILYRTESFLSDMLTVVELLEIQEINSIPPIIEKYNLKLDDIFQAEEKSIEYVEKLKKSLFDTQIQS